ncbi:MAG: type II secretion system F family protein [Patescibacteria group bacterium]
MRFLYKAKTLDGETVEGKLEALSQQGAVDFLINKGLVILSLEENKGGGIFSLKIKIGTGVREKDMVLFARQLSVMVGAGLPLVSALDVISKQTTNYSFKDVILNITDNVRGGARLSSALDKYKNIFSSFYINMIRAGETSGKLDEVLTYLADEQEKNYDLISKVKGAMTYPIFILVMVAVVAFGMMTFVVPKLTSILTEAGVALPLPTRILIATSNFSSKYWLIKGV